MAAVDDPRTLGRARLSFADKADVAEFVSTLAKFESGEITPEEWRAFRLVRGTYGQRQAEDAQMLRIKIPQGVLDPSQLEALADVGDRFSRGFGHVTTRQNVQFHFVKLHDVEHAMDRLEEAGLTTREACGNSVRNITACPYAGVSRDEAFDVTPYAEALTRHFLRHPLSSRLPRKFKIAFEGCPEDHAVTAINDIGFRAALRDGRRGFRVTVAGGTSILCTTGYSLYEFLPAERLLDVAEAVLRVFHRLGDYKHKQRNRLKFLIRDIGWDAWRAAYDQALADVRAEGGKALPFDSEAPPVEGPPEDEAPAPRRLAVRSAAYDAWTRTNVRPQKQPHYAIVTVTLKIGDVTTAQLRTLARVAQACADGVVRLTPEQNVVMRWVRHDRLPELYEELAAAGLGADGAGTAADVGSCPGADTCRIAVTQSRGLGTLLTEHLRARPELVAAAGPLDLKISGCPNGCGQHHVAGIGFQGSVRRLGDRVAPQYFVMLGGGFEADHARFGRLAAKIPARRVPQAVERLIELYVEERAGGETATQFFKRVDLERVKTALADLEAMTLDQAEPADFVDLGESREFKVEAMDGECMA